MTAVIDTFTTLRTGIFRDLTDPDYRAINAASQSRLSDVARSPAHCLERMTHPPESTPALLFGSAFHSAVLTPFLFCRDYTVAAQCEAIKKSDGTRCTNGGVMRCNGEWYCGVHCKGLTRDGGLTILADEDARRINAMADAIHSHPSAGKLLGGVLPENRELSAVWTDPETECPCKMRADAVNPLAGVVVDLKTTEDASEDAFTKTIFNYGYHRQAAMYLRGLCHLGISVQHFVLIAVEKMPPYAVAVYRLKDEAVGRGDEELMPLIATYKRCHDSGEWPAYSDRVTDIGLPRWAMKQEL